MATRRIALSEGRRPGWYWAGNEIIDVHGAEMKPRGLAIYHALCRHADQNGEAWPSYTTLAEETGMSVTTVKKAIKNLCKLNLIKKQVRQYESKGPTSNLYTLLPTLGQNTPQGGAESASDLGRNTPTNNSNMKKTKRRISTTEPSLAVKETVLRDFGVKGRIVTKIAENHDMAWIRKAMAEMDNPSPGSVVYLHREGWEPPSEEDDTMTPIYCSECADLEDVCVCPDPKPRRVLLSELTNLNQRRREAAVRSAANPDPDRLQRFDDVHKRFPDTPHELLEFEEGLQE